MSHLANDAYFEKYDELENLAIDGMLRIGSATLQMKDYDKKFDGEMRDMLLKEFPGMKDLFLACEKLCIERWHMNCIIGHDVQSECNLKKQEYR